MFTAGGFFLWRSNAEEQTDLPPPPVEARSPAFLRQSPLSRPPSAPERSKEEKRFARADKDSDGRISKVELLQPRQKAFGKLDTDGDGKLSFDEWTVKTTEKFANADVDRSGWLNPSEYEAMKSRKRKKA